MATTTVPTSLSRVGNAERVASDVIISEWKDKEKTRDFYTVPNEQDSM